MFVAGWRHALRSEWPFIIIISGTSGADRRCNTQKITLEAKGWGIWGGCQPGRRVGGLRGKNMGKSFHGAKQQCTGLYVRLWAGARGEVIVCFWPEEGEASYILRRQ